MHTPVRTLTALAAMALIASAIPAEAAGRGGVRGGGHGAHVGHGGHGWHGSRGGWAPRPVWGGIGLGLGVGLGLGYYYGWPWVPGYVVVDAPPVVWVDTPPAPPPPPAPGTAAPAATAPAVVYPRNGQSPAQTDADRAACERWASEYPRALSDSSIYQRAMQACMEGRGYTLK